MASPKTSQIQEIARRFTYHAPTGTQAGRYEQIRSLCGQVAQELISICPESRELDQALTRLDEAVFWANASIARRENTE